MGRKLLVSDLELWSMLGVSNANRGGGVTMTGTEAMGVWTGVEHATGRVPSGLKSMRL